jgi:hypothetical protein
MRAVDVCSLEAFLDFVYDYNGQHTPYGQSQQLDDELEHLRLL